MFPRVFKSFGTLYFLQQPQLYLLSKFFILISIIFQQVFLIVGNEQGGQTLTFSLQILALLLLFAFEYLFVWYFSSRKIHLAIQISSILFINIIFSQILLEVALLTFQTLDRSYTEIAYQEIFFINAPLILFTDTEFLKGGLLLYIAATSIYRLTSLANKTLYISSGIIFAVFLGALMALINRKEKAPSSLEISTNQNKFSKFENVLEGVALVGKDKQVLYMNGLFKGLLEANDEKEALDKILRLKRFESSSTADKKASARETRQINNTNTPKSELRSFGDLHPKSTTDHPTSLEVPKSGNFLGAKPHSPRTSIFQHAALSFSQNMPSTIIEKRSFNLPESMIASKNLDLNPPSALLPIIKIKPPEEDPRHIWGNESESRVPFIKITPEHSFVAVITFDIGESSAPNSGFRETKMSNLSSPNVTSYVESSNPEQIALQIDSTDRMENIEAIFENMFASMNRTADRKKILIISQPIESLSSPLDTLKGNVNAKDQGTASEGSPNKEELKVVLNGSKQGTRILEVILYPFIYLQKEFLCICTRDVSCEVKIEDISETLDYKDRLLRFVSHEFRTPLNCSITLLDLLKNYVPNDLCTKYVLPALNSSRMLLNLANDILDHAQIQARKFKISITPCKIRRVFEEVVELMKIQTIGKKTDLRVIWDSRIPQRFYTDPTRLQQILLNLISNGLKYTKGGNITLKASFESPTICKVSVTDTGVGISRENLKILFQEFGKIQDNSHLNPKGVGLGLVISKLLSHELGPDGKGITVESEEGKGTVFSFFLESKIDKCADELDELGELESLDENSSYHVTSIKTTHAIWDDISPRKPSGAKSPKEQEVNINVSVNNFRRPSKIQTISPEHFAKQESPSSRIMLNIPRSKTLESFDSLRSYPKKKSSDNILFKPHRRIVPLMVDSKVKDGKKPFQRSYTLESKKKANNIESDLEFNRFLRKVQHTCNNPQALLVDDSMFNLTALDAILKTFGIKSKTALDGEQAIQEVLKNEKCCFKCKNFKVIFMDIEMPKLNGFETTQILRKKMLEGEISFIPIIGITGHNPSENRVQCLVSGMNDMTSKPISPNIIKKLIIKWMD